MSKKLRKVCLLITEKIYKFQRFSEILENCPSYLNLSIKEKSLVNMTILTMLRRNGEIEAIIERFLKKPLNSKQYVIKNTLRLATTQIVFLNVADHSVVNGYVELVKEIRFGYEKLVNGILRNICRNKPNLLKETNTLKNLPSWIKFGWEKSLNHDIVKNISEAITNIPKTDIHIKKKSLVKEKWQKDLGGEIIFDNVLRLNKTEKIENLKGYETGDWWVQNAAASIPVKIIEKIFYESNNISVLEIGSSPGGKTIQLLDAGFNVTALEKSKNRVAILEKNLQRVNYQCRIYQSDIDKFKSKNNFDCCLLDVSCSSSGIVGRKPEILIFQKSIRDLVINQKTALRKASKLIKKNGFLIYSVCSLIFEEGENQIENFLKRNRNFRRICLKKIFSKKFDLHYKNGDIMTLPTNYRNEGGLDGFYISCLQKYK